MRYWYIVYSWFRDERKYDDAVFAGELVDWIAMSKRQPEDWLLVFAHEISEQDYFKLGDACVEVMRVLR